MTYRACFFLHSFEAGTNQDTQLCVMAFNSVYHFKQAYLNCAHGSGESVPASWTGYLNVENMVHRLESMFCTYTGLTFEVNIELCRSNICSIE